MTEHLTNGINPLVVQPNLLDKNELPISGYYRQNLSYLSTVVQLPASNLRLHDQSQSFKSNAIRSTGFLFNNKDVTDMIEILQRGRVSFDEAKTRENNTSEMAQIAASQINISTHNLGLIIIVCFSSLSLINAISNVRLVSPIVSFVFIAFGVVFFFMGVLDNKRIRGGNEPQLNTNDDRYAGYIVSRGRGN